MTPLYCIPTLHPSYILRGQFGLDPAQPVYLRRAWEIANGQTPAVGVVEGGPPAPSTTLPTLSDIRDWLDRNVEGLRPTPLLACDIECAGNILVAIGFHCLQSGETICIPLRRKGGMRYWLDDHDLERVAILIAEVLADPHVHLIFHNGQAFDVPYLTAMGFTVNGYIGDTLIMQHLAYPEMPKDLEFTSILYTGAEPWKWLSKAGTPEEGK